MNIDQLNAHLEVTPGSRESQSSAGATTSSGLPSSPPDLIALKEFLRPIVNEIVAEELRLHLRTQGR